MDEEIDKLKKATIAKLDMISASNMNENKKCEAMCDALETFYIKAGSPEMAELIRIQRRKWKEFVNSLPQR